MHEQTPSLIVHLAPRHRERGALNPPGTRCARTGNAQATRGVAEEPGGKRSPSVLPLPRAVMAVPRPRRLVLPKAGGVVGNGGGAGVWVPCGGEEQRDGSLGSSCLDQQPSGRAGVLGTGCV